jgi:hypothetical protein
MLTGKEDKDKTEVNGNFHGGAAIDKEKGHA